jgi:hypothetical protein
MVSLETFPAWEQISDIAARSPAAMTPPQYAVDGIAPIVANNPATDRHLTRTRWPAFIQ